MCALGGVVALCLAACGPLYIDSFEYHPIASATGRRCVGLCQDDQGKCRQREDRRYEDCENGPMDSSYECFGQTCQMVMIPPSCRAPDYKTCEDDYRECYLDCGGKVTQTTQCAERCEQAAPPRVYVLSRPTPTPTAAPKKSKR